MEVSKQVRHAALAVLLASNGFWLPVSAHSFASSAVTDPALDLLLTREAQRLLDNHLFDNARQANITVRASVDVVQGRLLIEFGPGILPAEDDHSVEEIEQFIRNTLEEYAQQAGVRELDTQILYEGKPYLEHFPDAAVIRSGRAGHMTRTDTALVSAGHGLLRVHPGGEWEFQRPSVNGIQEDLTTATLADELQQLLQDRGELRVERARRGGVDPHPESARPWAEMSARYHLKDRLPDRSDIWNHFANSTANNREVLDDIRARPQYANHLGVSGMLSIHTNAESSGAARGARVYYHSSKPADRGLANMTLCYMREIITAQEAYAEFPVAPSGGTADHGENRLATMPSIVVETAFHTNAQDAAALQDPVFRTAAMKGVEKGFRLFRDGKDCQPLTVEKITDVETPSGGRSEVEVHFKGFPQFPVTLEVAYANCQPGWICDGGNVVIRDPVESPIRFLVECGGGNGGSSRWRTTMRDADGVKAAPMEHQQTCLAATPPAPTRAVGQMKLAGRP